MNITRVVIFILAVCGSTLAKDKSKENNKPSVDPTLLVGLAKKQRDFNGRSLQVQPLEMELDRRKLDIDADVQKAQEQCGDVMKWKFNAVVLECEEVKAPPPPPAPPSSESPKPKEKEEIKK